MMEKKEIVQSFLQKGYLISPEFVEKKNLDLNSVLLSLDTAFQEKDGPLIINEFVLSLVNSRNHGLNWMDFEKARVLFEKGRDELPYRNFIKTAPTQNTDQLTIKPSVKILKNYLKPEKKIDLQDFVEYFRTRYKGLREILEKRQELQDVISINKI